MICAPVSFTSSSLGTGQRGSLTTFVYGVLGAVLSSSRGGEGLAKEEGWQAGSRDVHERTVSRGDGLRARTYYGPVSGSRPSHGDIRDHRGLRCLRPYIHSLVQTIRVFPDLLSDDSLSTKKSRSSRDPGEGDGTTLVPPTTVGDTRFAVSGLPVRAYRFSPEAPERVRGVLAAGFHHPGSLVATTSLYYSPSTLRIDL